MRKNTQRNKQAGLIRAVRKVHRTTAILLFAFFIIVSVTGLLLGWKKNSNGTILPRTQTGTSTDLKDWLPLDSLHKNACLFLRDSVSKNLSTEVDRIDIRKDKGIVKFTFKGHYYGVQVDGATGKLLQVKKRNSDLIENIHDGSALDRFFGTSGEPIKLIYITIMGTSLLIFAVTGFWLWYGPKRMRKRK